MNSIRVLDVTLRDGGCVNNFNFGQSYMEKILAAQEESGVDMIELGYLDHKNGSSHGRTQYISEHVISEYFLKKKRTGQTYVAMMDYGKYDVDQMAARSESGIDGVRLAFHKKNRMDMIPLGRKIMDKGYQFFIQPMITLRYSDKELLELIDVVNQKLPDASGFYIVDSFGEMRPNDMSRLMNLVDHNLIQTMSLGFHSHNNLQMSYSNAVSLLQFPTNRDLMLDSSIMGMGKGAGNLNTELLLEHLNIFYGKHYNIAPLLEVMDKVINQLHSEFYWGYSPEYYLSAINHCTPSYASHFYNKHMLPIDQVSELLGMLNEDKKISFDQKYAEHLYTEYNAGKAVDDTFVIRELKEELLAKEILLIAPGKSIENYRDRIADFASRDNVIAISLNLIEDFGQRYVLITRKEIYDEGIENGSNIIVMSSVSKGGRGNVKVLNYENWIERNGKTYDSSSIVAFKLIESCGCSKVYLAGFDGFSVGINENYYNSLMRVPVTDEQARERNKFYTERIHKMIDSGIKVECITPTRYMEIGNAVV